MGNTANISIGAYAYDSCSTAHSFARWKLNLIDKWFMLQLYKKASAVEKAAAAAAHILLTIY